MPAALQVRCGKPSVMNSAVPRTTSSMPSVTRKDGILSRVTNRPLTRPISAATTSATTKADLQRGDAAVEQRPHQHRREAEQRADREVEFARRHQQRHRQRDQAELDGEGQGVGDVLRRQEVGIDRPEDDELDDEQHQRPEFGPARSGAGRGAIFHADPAMWWHRLSACAAARPAIADSRGGVLAATGSSRRAYLPDRILS